MQPESGRSPQFGEKDSMDNLFDLFLPENTSLAATIILLSFVIAAGIFIGKIKIAGVSLGVTFVLFVGILMGHFRYEIDPGILKFVREFGLILFIFSIGLQVGPGFFSSFKKGGLRLNGLALLGISLNVVLVLIIYYSGWIDDIPALVGVMSGAVTNTPGLAAAQQTVATIPGVDPEAVNTMANGYAAAYPLGVLGIILSMFIVKWVFRIRNEQEISNIEKEQEDSHLKPFLLSVKVTNALIDGHSMLQLHDVVQTNFVVSRLMGSDGKVTIPKSSTAIHTGDILLVV